MSSLTFLRPLDKKQPNVYGLQRAYLLGTTAATAVIAATATAATTLVVILFVLLELTRAGCRTEISPYTFSF